MDSIQFCELGLSVRVSFEVMVRFDVRVAVMSITKFVCINYIELGDRSHAIASRARQF